MSNWIKICKRCNSKVTSSKLKQYSYQCLCCDEDLYDFETISIDMQHYLDKIFESVDATADEYDIMLLLGEKGITLNDTKGTAYYEKFQEYTRTHSWEK